MSFLTHTNIQYRSAEGSKSIGIWYLRSQLFILINVFRSFQTYTLKRGISGKDLGKRGTKLAEEDVPEALGIVPGAIFLICLILCLVGYATSHPTKVRINSAIHSFIHSIYHSTIWTILATFAYLIIPLPQPIS